MEGIGREENETMKKESGVKRMANERGKIQRSWERGKEKYGMIKH